MQLTQFTDYSLRALIFIGLRENNHCSVSDIAKSYGISRNHLVKVVNHLSQLGYVQTIRGYNGGVKLSMRPSEINIGEVVQKVEPNFHIVECFDGVKNNCLISPACKLKHALYKAQRSFLDVLNEYTLADVLINKSELTELFQQNTRAIETE